MKITTVSVTYGGVLNLGNYQSARMDVTLGAEIEPHEDPNAVAQQLFDQARASVQERARPLITQKGALVDGVFTALPAAVRSSLKEFPDD